MGSDGGAQKCGRIGEGDLPKKITSSFGVTAFVLCKHPTRMPRSTFLTFRIFRFSRGSTPPDLLLNNAPKYFKLF